MNITNNNKLRECLLISCVSKEQHHTLLLNPLTGTSVRSLCGNELRNSIVSVVEPLGRDVSHLCFPIANKPVVYITALNAKNSQFASFSQLPGIVRCVTSHPTGRLLFGAIENQIFAWTIPSGELLSAAGDALQEISVLKLSSCGSYIVAGVGDGNLKFYTLHSLVERRNHDIEPVRAFRSIAAHSLRVTDLYVSGGNQPRVLSASLDHTVVLTAVEVTDPLLKLCVDQPVTACCMDPAETRIILGVKSGRIAIVNLYDYTPDGGAVLKIGNGEANDVPSGLRVLEHHTAEVCRLCVNADAQLFASGDAVGGYAIWDMQNGQCLKASTMRGVISTLRFTEYWPQLDADQKKEPRARYHHALPAMGQLQSVMCSAQPPAEPLAKIMKSGRKAKINEFLYGQFEELIEIVKTASATSSSKLDGMAANRLKIRSLFDNDPQFVTNATETASDVNSVDKTKSADDDTEILDSSMTLNEPAAGKPSKSVGGRHAIKQAERIRELERELRRLQKANQELYENAAKLLFHTDL